MQGGPGKGGSNPLNQVLKREGTDNSLFRVSAVLCGNDVGRSLPRHRLAGLIAAVFGRAMELLSPDIWDWYLQYSCPLHSWSAHPGPTLLLKLTHRTVMEQLPARGRPPNKRSAHSNSNLRLCRAK